VSLQRDIAPDELRKSEVLLDGQPLRQSEMDGYILRDSRHLAVGGAACDAIRETLARALCGVEQHREAS